MNNSIIVQVFTSLDECGGAETVVYTLYTNLKHRGYNSKIATFSKFENISKNYEITHQDYIHLNHKLIRKYSNVIVISHSRKLTSLIIVLNRSLNLNLEIIHVAHTVFETHKKLSIFPNKNIAVSASVKENLIDYFKIPEEKIEIIYNGIFDKTVKTEKVEYDCNKEIKILHAARISNEKRQLEIVENLTGKLKPNIKIYFAGKGKNQELLQKKIINNPNFEFLGFHEDIPQLICDFHYMLLFSLKEGLGLTLVESCMSGRPMISKGDEQSKACSEVCINGVNGYIANTFNDLIKTLNSLDLIPKDDYTKMCNNSREIYESKFNLDKMIDNYIRVINCNQIIELGTTNG